MIRFDRECDGARNDYQSRVSLHDVADNAMQRTRDSLSLSLACIMREEEWHFSAPPSLRLFPRNAPPGASITSFLHDLPALCVAVLSVRKCNRRRAPDGPSSFALVFDVLSRGTSVFVSNNPPPSPITAATPLTDLSLEIFLSSTRFLRALHIYIRALLDVTTDVKLMRCSL